MHPAVENFLSRPLKQKLGIAAGSLILPVLLFYQLSYKAKASERTELEAKVEDLSSKIAYEQRLARNLPTVRQAVKELEVKLKFALAELPDKREIPDLLDSVSKLARSAGLDVTLFKTSTEATKEFYAEVPVMIAVEGTFHQVATFFDEVANLPRIVNISDISIKEPKVAPEQVRVKTECTATTFRYLEESERVKGDDPGKKRRRK